MANPLLVEIPADTWTPVLTEAFSGTVKIIKEDPDAYYETYRVAGDPAPTQAPGDADFDGYPFKEFLCVSDGSGVDVYVYAVKKVGKVRVDS